MSKMYNQNYKFDNDDDILNSFSKIYKEYDMEYNPNKILNIIESDIS